MSAIADVGSEVPTPPLCQSLGVSQAALYRWRQPKLATEPKPQRARHPRPSRRLCHAPRALRQRAAAAPESAVGRSLEPLEK